MSLIRWEPFGAMDDFFRMPSRFWRLPRLSGLSEENGSGGQWSPAVDISETEAEYLIKAELPAVKKEDVRVTVDDRMLTISGERKQEKEQSGEKFHRIESFHGSFVRSFTLPESIDAAAIRAESKDGVLTVHVPKSKIEAKKPMEIRVQ